MTTYLIAAMLAGPAFLAGAPIASAAERSVTYDCFDKSVLKVKFLDGNPPSVVLARGEEEVLAEQVASASGAKYEAEDGIMFWDKGGEAILDWDIKKGIICQVQ